MLNLRRFPGEAGPLADWERGFKIEMMNWSVITAFPPSHFFSVPFSEHGEETVSGFCHFGFSLFRFPGIDYLRWGLMFNGAGLCYAGSWLGTTDPTVPEVSSCGDGASLRSLGTGARRGLRQLLPPCWLWPPSPVKAAAVGVQELEPRDAFTHQFSSPNHSTLNGNAPKRTGHPLRAMQ